LNFKSKLFLFFSNHTVWHLDCNPFSYMQVRPTKFTFVKLKSRMILGNLSDFSRRIKPLYKFIKVSNGESVPVILTLILLRIGCQHNLENCS
jgi:hypothetical protein